MNKNKFKDVTKLVIDKLEGGYFHPNMRTANPTKFGAYHRSGETMFGLDRHAGHDLYYSTPRKKLPNGQAIDVLSNLKFIENGSYQYKNPQSKEFWELIDKVNAKNNWKWNYKGGSLEPRLKELASEILYPKFETYLNAYVKNDKAKDLIKSDNRLLFHMIYGIWNGSGWFQKFAGDLNKAVTNGITNPDQLANVALNSRLNEGLRVGSKANDLIKQGGEKIKKLFTTLKNAGSNLFTTENLPTTDDLKKKSNIIYLVVLIGAFFLYKKLKK
jgi:hypothetical protein